MTALKTYLSTREDLKNLESEILMAAQELLSEIDLRMDGTNEIDLIAPIDSITELAPSSQLMISFN
jgi:exonuclease SbcD